MATPLKPGDTFDRYSIDAVIGRGGMGVVYRAHDARLERRIALKVVSDPDASPESQEQIKARVVREARAVAALDHPNVVTIHDVGEVDGTPYIAMELVDGKTLRERAEGGATVAERLGWLLDAARALAAAHRAGIVHRDVKPENVMVRGDGRVKVLDFGIARRSSSDVDAAGPTQPSALATLTAKGIQVGTPMYMAPEQIRGEPLDGRSDQFSWGVLAHEVLEGTCPWRGTDALALVASILTAEPAPMQAKGVPPKVKEIIGRALSKSAAERFGSMDDVIAVLAPFATGGAPVARSGHSQTSDPEVTQAPGPTQDARDSAGAAPPAIEPKARPTEMQRFSTEEMGEVLQRALERQSTERRYSYGELVEAAREVGIDEAAIRQASRSLSTPAAPPGKGTADADAGALALERPELERHRQRQRLLRHFAMWAVFGVFFLLLNLLTTERIWFIYPVLGWGVGVAMHAVKYFFPVEPTPEERAFRLARRRRRARRRLGKDYDKEIEAGVSLLLSSAERRARIATLDDAAGSPRVRVARDDSAPADITADLASEVEAAAAAESRQRRA